MEDLSGRSFTSNTPLGHAPTADDESDCYTSSLAAPWEASPPLSIASPNQPAVFQCGTTASDKTPNFHASNTPTYLASPPHHTLLSQGTTQYWEALKPTIALYCDEGKSRSEIQALLKRDFSFHPKPRQLTYRLGRWQLSGRGKAANGNGIVPPSYQALAQDNNAALLRHGGPLPTNNLDSLQRGTDVPVASHTQAMVSSPTSIAHNNPTTPSITFTTASAQQYIPTPCRPPPPTATRDQLPTTPFRSSEQLSSTETAIQIQDWSSTLNVYGDMLSSPSALCGPAEAQNYNSSINPSGVDITEEQDFRANFPLDDLREAIDTDNNNRFKSLVRRAIRETDSHPHDHNLAKHAQKALEPLVFSIIKRGNTSIFRFLVARKLILPQQSKGLCIIAALVNGHSSIVNEIFKRHTPAVLDLDHILHHAHYIRKSYKAHSRYTAEVIFDLVHQQHLKSPNNVSAVHIATALLLDDKIDHIARRSDISVPMANGHTALHILSYQDFSQDSDKATRVANILLGHGVDVNKRDAAGNTCLHTMASKYHASWTPVFIEMLIQHRVNVNIRNNDGKTAMELMAFNFPLDETTLELMRRLKCVAASVFAN